MKNYLFLLCFVFLGFSVLAQEVPQDWFHYTPNPETHYGVGTHELYSQIINKIPGETVVVAIIDSGVDIEHEDLKDVIWVNTDEIPDNGIDDDKNGYVDDVNGWNFIGGKNGDVNEDTYEVTRLYKKYKYKFENANVETLKGNEKKEYEKFLVCKEEVEAQLEKANKDIARMNKTKSDLIAAIDAVASALDSQELTPENIDAIDAETEKLTTGKGVVMRYMDEENPTFEGVKANLSKEFQGGFDYYEGKLKYAYNTDFETREIIGDNYADADQRIYGNNHVEGPDALHGTHVAGIVAASRNNDVGMDGVANNVRIMSVRTVPNGDERDKDVANAIRYAVDNGAKIINMSFGKGFSWNKEVVDKAVKYAEKHDVLMVHAAGNSSQNNDVTDNFPNDEYNRKGFFKFLQKKKAANWLEVGALSYNTDERLVAPFSNYGIAEIDLFAPGMAIYATVPDDNYRNLQGTSMAAPVVAGVAAILRSYFPTLSAKDVIEILASTSTKIDQEVILPGDKDKKVQFSSLSGSGGVVNAYRAFLKAMEKTGTRDLTQLKSNSKV